jgi:molybdenum cofactor biosynthesis enzyme MoaA
VLAGIAAATSAGLAVQINVVARKSVNDDEARKLVAWAPQRADELLARGDADGHSIW